MTIPSQVRVYLAPDGARWLDLPMDRPLSAFMSMILQDRWLLTDAFAIPIESIHSVFALLNAPATGGSRESPPATVHSLFGTPAAKEAGQQ